MKISKHSENDWCHLCGRRERYLADIWYTARKIPNDYIRICYDCGNSIIHASEAESNEDNS